MRPKDKSDPDPKLATVLLHIWPLMILVTLANLLFLVLIAGLTGWLIFPELFICYGINLSTLSFFCKVRKPVGDPEEGRETTEDRDTLQKETQSFIAMAALSSLWLPSVVGPQSQRIFLVSSIASLASKVLLLLVAVPLADSGLLAYVHARPFLLFCFDENSLFLRETNITRCSFSDSNCFQTRNMTREKGKVDVLGDFENVLKEYDRIVSNIDDDLKAEIVETNSSFQNKLDSNSPLLGEIHRIKGNYEEELRSSGVGKVEQKIRICERNETPFRLKILAGLLVVIALAAAATLRLHRIADYQVIETKMK